jgi:hypothetical protein
MISISEMSKIISYLLADSGRETRLEKVQVWFDQFHHLDHDVAWQAAKLLNVRGFREWEPRTSEFREAVAEVSRKPEDRISGDEAFGLAVEAIKRFGYYREKEALGSLPPRVAVALSRFGFKELCQSNERDASIHRAQFARVYDASSKRIEFSETTKPELGSKSVLEIDGLRKFLGGKS